MENSLNHIKMGKNKNKNKTPSEGSASGSTQQSTSSSSSGGRPQQAPAQQAAGQQSVRQRLLAGQGPSQQQQPQRSGGQSAQGGAQAQQQRPNQPSGQQQQRQNQPAGQQQQRPNQPSGQQQQRQNQPAGQQQWPNQPSGQQAWRGPSQPQAQSQQRQNQPAVQQQRQPQPSEQQAWRGSSQPQAHSQQQQQPRQAQQQQDRSRGPQPSGSGLSRAESVQSIQSTHSAKSSGSGGKPPPQKSEQEKQNERIPPELLKGLELLTIATKNKGTKGRKLPPIETNYLKINMTKLDKAFHYDVRIEPERPKKLLPRAFLRFVEVNFPREAIAYDGMNSAYSSRVLPIKPDIQREVTIIHPETGAERRYIVNIKPANDSEINIRQQLTTYANRLQREDPNDMKRAMQAIEVIFKAAFYQDRLQRGVQGGRSFFLPADGERTYLGDFYELWLGLFQSVVLGSVPFLNIDVNHKAFPKRYDNLIDLFRDMEQDLRMRIDPSRPLERNVIFALEKHLGGLEICYRGPGAAKIYKFMKLVNDPANERFTTEDGQQKTILQYFRETNRNIRYPSLPCIKLGNTVKSITVPMELCSIPDTQVINKRCTENQTRNIIRIAATNTDDRKAKIMRLLSQITHNQSPVIQGFGLSVDSEFVKVQPRLLDPPKLEYGDRRTITPSRGVWRGEEMKFLVPRPGMEYAILNTNGRTGQNEMRELAAMLTKISKQSGLNLADGPYIMNVSDRDSRQTVTRLGNELSKIAKENRYQIVFVIIPDSGPTYALVKQKAELDHGVLTQCIKGGTVFRKRNDGSTISNICLKVNAKLNGINHKLQTSAILTKSPGKVMVIGADVTHPSPDQRSIPSVVGVSASHDANAFCYNMRWRLQDPKTEIIKDFKNIVVHHLNVFKEKNGEYPAIILYYRDGVSEGQFDQVMAIERRAMVDACRQVKQGYEKTVKMTVVVVQKRHHTRFFPGNTGVGREDRKNNNVPAGTIVDNVIVRPTENQFYLVSHQSIQGVAKPTKYCILLDEANHSIDDLQELTYNLCHMFARCNRSVSYPAPTYYAHLAAARGKAYVETDRLNMNNLQKEYNDRQIKDNIILGHPMYFI